MPEKWGTGTGKTISPSNSKPTETDEYLVSISTYVLIPLPQRYYQEKDSDKEISFTLLIA